MSPKETGNTKREGQGSLYDKIVRENLMELFWPLIEERLNFKPIKVSPLPDKQPTTVLRETDGFLLIETASKIEPKFILHLEFESKNDTEMVYRMSEYHGIELRKYHLPIKHVVVYLGERKPTMRTTLDKTEVFEGFTLVNCHDFSPSKWLKQDEPAKIIMAILSDYQKQNAELILKAIMQKLRRVCKSEAELKKFIEQLIIISRMRNLEKLTIKISKAMPIMIDIENDYLYKMGIEKAEKKAKKEKAELEAKMEREKAELKAKAEKASKEKIELEARAEKVSKEKIELEAKAEKVSKEKIELEAKIKSEKKEAVQKMKATQRFSDAEIMELLVLDEKTFKTYLEEIEG